MSSTIEKRPIDRARADAEDFRSLFPRDSYERWEIAGSVRRGKPEVGDIEHVIIPRFGEVDGGGLFGEPVKTNLLWAVLESMLDGTQDAEPGLEIEDEAFNPHSDRVMKAVYTDKNNRDSYRWGEKYRGVLFRGFKHEMFTADAQNWGAILAIRTGSADYSHMLVTRLMSTALRQNEGYLRYKDGSIYPCPTEEAFFAACGVPFTEPANRTTNSATR